MTRASFRYPGRAGVTRQQAERVAQGIVGVRITGLTSDWGFGQGPIELMGSGTIIGCQVIGEGEALWVTVEGDEPRCISGA